MKKINKKIAVLICCGIIAAAAAGVAFADPVILSGAVPEENEVGPSEENDDGSSLAAAMTVEGPVLQVNDEYILINSVSETGPAGMVSLRVDPDTTLILDAVNGYPIALSDIEEGETVCAYVGAAMTLSLPPQMTASMIICQIPDGGSAPLFTKVISVNTGDDNGLVLTVAGGASVTVPADCTVLPYLTRNVVTLSDITPGRNCLIWTDENGIADKIVLFAQ